LYTFAEAAPALAASLRDLPEGIRGLHEALAQMRETAGTLDDLHSSFSLAFLKLPNASDYEPLVDPLLAFARESPVLLSRLEETLCAVAALTRTLDERPPVEELRVLSEPARELALVAPALSEALSRLPPLVEPLTKSLSSLGPLTERIHAAAMIMGRAESTAAASEPASGPQDGRQAAITRIAAARAAILDALGTLPQNEEYAPFAEQLRAIASVSPSLLVWLGEIPALSAPLASSVQALMAAADELEKALELLR
jgi:hypothetical protein